MKIYNFMGSKLFSDGIYIILYLRWPHTAIIDCGSEAKSPLPRAGH